MRDIILRETKRGWLPIIVNQETGNEEYRGEFRDTTGIALEYAERALDEIEIIYAQRQKALSDVALSLLDATGAKPGDVLTIHRDGRYKVQEKLDGWRPKLPLDIDKYDSQNIPEGKG